MGGTNKRTNGQTNKQKSPVFYRTLSPSWPLPKKLGIGLIELVIVQIGLMELKIGLTELGIGLTELGIGLIELEIGLMELGTGLRINNARRTVLARVSGLVLLGSANLSCCVIMT